MTEEHRPQMKSSIPLQELVRATRWCRLAAALLLAASPALAQYPARGQPDPAFNGGRPWVVPNTPDATNSTYGFAVQPLSGTRFAVGSVRTNSTSDAILIVDTVPDRVTSFDFKPSVAAQQTSLWTLSTLGSAVLLGGSMVDASNKQYAVLELRDIGVDAVPVFEPRAAILFASTDPNYPIPITTAAYGQPSATGASVWQVRTRYSGNRQCATATLQRLDYTGGRFFERYQLDLNPALAQTCMFPLLVDATPSLAGDSAGSGALVIGGVCSDAPGSTGYACFSRVVDTGSVLLVDRKYGNNGMARLYGTADGDVLRLQDMKIDRAGNLFAAAFRLDTKGNYSAIAFKVNANGTLNTGFGGGGVVVASGGSAGAVASGIALTPGDVVQVVGNASGATGLRPYIAYLDATTGASQLSRLEFTAQEPDYYFSEFLGVAALPGGGALAVGQVQPTKDASALLLARLAGDRQIIDVLEYYNAGFDHYFVASVPDEIRKLDDGTFVGWRRTGESFAVFPLQTGGAADVCRFFSTKFVPRSSHFYTQSANECAGLKSGDVWSFEGMVFGLGLPIYDGSCPAGTHALYRLYNDGHGGAPNHRYTVSDSLRLAQLGQGWIGEGTGSPPVFACVPD
jgi:hypothetical protein